ncbi:MAG TPA: dihydroorotate dehydrogenase [Thermoplasmatales archaeon]|nr:dihydroorotate dehydrogenase [Thermoplasmatales archaeon]
MLGVEIAGIKMKNPLMLASGILDLTKESMERFVDAGAVVTKSVGREERKGYKNPVVYEMEYGILNAIGLANPGVEEYVKELEGVGVENVIGSVFGGNAEEFGYVARKISPYVKAIEMNMSCPHAKRVGAEYPEDEIPDAVKEVKKAGKPVFVKLGMENILNRAERAIEGGADAVVAINTVKAMAIDIETGHPILSNRVGGYSGKGIKPIGVRCVYEISSNYEIPVIGVGGVTRAEDVIEYMMAGARAVQIGTGVYYRDVSIFSEIAKELEEWLEKHGYTSIKDVIGIAIKK